MDDVSKGDLYELFDRENKVFTAIILSINNDNVTIVPIKRIEDIKNINTRNDLSIFELNNIKSCAILSKVYRAPKSILGSKICNVGSEILSHISQDYCNAIL